MERFFSFLLYYLLFINTVSAAVCLLDKIQAKRHGRRISEKTLFFISAAGGSVGMYATMRIIRHKTLHKRFMIGIPLIFAVQALLLIYLYFKYFY